MSLRERQPYMEESERLKHLHARQYPTYKVIIIYKKIILVRRKHSLSGPSPKLMESMCSG